MKIKILLLAITILTGYSCQENQYLKGKEDKNLNITFKRFDREFNALKEQDIESAKIKLEAKYGEFFNIYNQGILKMGKHLDNNYNHKVLQFLNDSIYHLVYDTVQNHYPDLEVDEEILTKAFRNYHLVFPDRQIPQCFTHVSGFNEPIVVGDSILSISLENYLGQDHEFYKNLGTYNYLLPRKNREYLSVDAMRGWLESEFPYTLSNTNLLNNILQEGKYLFILSVLMPDIPPHLIIGITEEQYLWCLKNESNVWQFMIEKQHLFSTHQLTISKYLQNGPFFNFFGSGTSPMVGKYIGWQIVSNYMQNNNNITIDDLLKTSDGQSILESSGYRP